MNAIYLKNTEMIRAGTCNMSELMFKNEVCFPKLTNIYSLCLYCCCDNLEKNLSQLKKNCPNLKNN